MSRLVKDCNNDDDDDDDDDDEDCALYGQSSALGFRVKPGFLKRPNVIGFWVIVGFEFRMNTA